MQRILPRYRPASRRAIAPRAAARVLAIVAVAACAACGGSKGGGGEVEETPSASTPPSPDTPAKPVGIGACLNEALYQTAGTTSNLRYAVTRSGAAKTLAVAQTVEAPEAVGGVMANKLTVRETLESAGAASAVYEGAQYLRLEADQVRLLGSASSVKRGQTTATRRVSLSAPLVDLDFSLEPGASTTGSATVSTTYDPAIGQAVPFPLQTTVRFDGLETITVPAGTFENACRFTVDVTTSSVRRTVRWIAAGSGVLLRSESGGDTQELVSGSINGQGVTP
ncbi:MAG: hypothetical protein QM766_12830 [Burkholderiaceae bacterium]